MRKRRPKPQKEHQQPLGIPEATEERGDTMSLANDVDSLVRIKAFGIGGGGGNAVSRMAREASPGVEYIAVNTDAQALMRTDAPIRLRIGDALTRGLGAGGNPEIGRQAAEESRDDIYEAVKGSDMVFIACIAGLRECLPMS